MIILPDRHILKPIDKHWWMISSQAQPKDEFGNQDHMEFKLTARKNGNIVWVGWFEDRDEADVFICALLKVLHFGKKMPINLQNLMNWDDSLAAYDVSYSFEAIQFLSNYAGQQLEWIVPPDWSNPNDMPLEYLFFSSSPTYVTSGTSDTVASNWNSSNNYVECVAGGGTGGSPSAAGGTGGGGGEYAKGVNITLTPGGSVSYQIGTAGAGSTSGNTTFNSTSVVATYGKNGSAGGAGGTGGTGTVKYNGGSGGTGNGSSNGGGGGGGSAGPNGNGGAGGLSSGPYYNAAGGGGGGGGAAGQANTSNGSVGATGGNGANTSGIVAGTGATACAANGANGNNGSSSSSSSGGGGGGATGAAGVGGAGGTGGAGTEWSASYGTGGGGGGAASGNSGSAYNGGAGGLYGAAGGGGSYAPNGTGGAAKQGLLVITYTPQVGSFNMPNLGL